MDREAVPGAAGPRAPSRAGTNAASRRIRHPALLLLVAAGVLLVGAAFELLRIRADLDAGRAALSELALDNLGGGLLETVDGAADRLQRADATADGSPFLATLSVLPLVGDQVDAVRDLTEATARLGDRGRVAAEAIDADLQRAGSMPAARLDLLDTVLEELDGIEQAVAQLDIGAEGRLVGPLRTARSSLVAELERVPDRFDEARGHVRALARLLRGPSRYLVLAANNAEMRGGAGMPLSGGVVTFEDGDVTFGEFEPLANRHVRGVDPALVPAELADTYDQFKVGRSWLQTAVSPSFPATAPIYAAMSAQFPLGPVEGVLEVDAVALRQLLAVIGPVELDGVTYTADNVESQILNENYLRFDTGDRAARQELQGELAAATFDALKERDIDVADLAFGLQAAARGRHLLAWSADPAVQELWDSVGATGALDPAGLMVTVQNIAANKLDWYIDPRVRVTASPRLGSGSWRVQLTVVVENPERERTSPAVESARAEPEYRDGMHRALVGVYLPAAAYDVRAVDQPVTEEGMDPPLQLIGTRLFVPEGEAASVTIEFSLPPDHFGVLLLPSGRVRPVTYEVNGVAITDAVPTAALFAAPERGDGRSWIPIAVGALVLGGVALAVVRHRDARRRPIRPR